MELLWAIVVGGGYFLATLTGLRILVRSIGQIDFLEYGWATISTLSAALGCLMNICWTLVEGGPNDYNINAIQDVGWRAHHMMSWPVIILYHGSLTKKINPLLIKAKNLNPHK